MAKLEEAIKELIKELERVQAPGAQPWESEDGPSMPGQIAAGNDQFILTSRKMEQLIQEVSTELKRLDPDAGRTHTDEEWNLKVRTAFGPALAPIEFGDDLNSNASLVLGAVRSSLVSSSVATTAREHAFGCTLFGTFDIDPFKIGPVGFEPRSVWLVRKATDGDVTNTTARRVTSFWGGGKPRRRTQGLEAIRERDILDAIGNCPYVCSVSTKGLAARAAEEKARTAARMAMTAIALIWQTPSRTLDGFNLRVDRSVRRQRSLVFIPNVKTLAGHSLQGMPSGPSISHAEWANQLAARRPQFEAAGEAIEFLLSATGSVTRPNLMNTLAQALLYFHEACREQVALMAIVKFAASLDALAVGRKSGGIKRLVTARLGVAASQRLNKAGLTMEDAIDEIYSEGRSRTIHGTNNKLGHDWSSTRALSEWFARACLIEALDWATQNPTNDDPLDLSK